MNDRYKEAICPECNKVFFPEYLLKWGWKNQKGENVCSYSCQRKSELKPVSKTHYRRDSTAVIIVESGEIFKSISECADTLDISVSWLSKCIITKRTIKGLHIEPYKDNEEELSCSFYKEE